MKCANYSPLNDGACLDEGTSPCNPNPDCSHGWIPFWTPSERAGIKAIGREHKLNRDFGIKTDAMASRRIIRFYIEASSRVKEGRVERIY